MEAMILAAGLGTRLAPLTDAVPKALIAVRGRPLLAHVMERLVAAGAARLIVNTSRHGDQIAKYLAEHAPSGVEILVSPEPDGPYDTGGGFLAAGRFFRRDGPILLHAVDVLSRIPLEALLASHRGAREHPGNLVLGTLAVQDRPSARRLLFDEHGLVGWEHREAGRARRVRESAGTVRDFAFAGIHVVEPSILDLAERTGTFPIVDLYLDLAARGYRIEPGDVSAHAWQDVGTPERLREANADNW